MLRSRLLRALCDLIKDVISQGKQSDSCGVLGRVYKHMHIDVYMTIYLLKIMLLAAVGGNP